MSTTIHPIASAPARPARIWLPKLLGGKPPAAPEVRVEDLHFVEAGTFGRLVLGFLRKLGLRISLCPVAHRGQTSDVSTPLDVIGRAMGFRDDRSQRLLRHHEERWRANVGPVKLILEFLLITLTVPALDLVPAPPSGSLALKIGIWTLSLLAQFTLMIALVVIVRRLAAVLLDRHFAESICAIRSLYLLVDLYREDVLARADHRRQLVTRFDELAHATRLLALRYGSSDRAMREKVQRHFREITHYIAERRTWAVTPVATTLDDLKRDMRELTRIFITGSYGEIPWPAAEAAAGTPVPAWKTAVRRMGRTMALLAPFVALGYLLVSPQAQQAYAGTGVLVILVSWAVISADTALELGFVTSVVGLAKSIKELK